MKNYVQEGDVLTVTAPYAVASGAGVLVGSLFGVASATAASGAEVEIKTTGVFDLPKATGAAWTVGQRLYWDDAAKNLTGTASTNKLVAVALSASASGDTVGRARLTAAFTL
jgi:predicted RecA/RadA family phage recombinase